MAKLIMPLKSGELALDVGTTVPCVKQSRANTWWSAVGMHQAFGSELAPNTSTHLKKQLNYISATMLPCEVTHTKLASYVRDNIDCRHT